ncbi:hypothetical protein [Rhodococcus phenolicus]|uniref:hypothetical protein n=1 Tax=Rhodococcus phenolicus TaxID=263849 RepID=UPI000832603B|nr:hypothetical protein [Rhodococcus phenolicus]
MNGYLTRAEITKLDAILRTIPWLAHQLDDTVRRQDRIGGAHIPSLGGTDSPEQPLPYNHAAADVRDQLRNTLVGWTRHTLEQRSMAYDGDDTLPGISRWLRRNIEALALTEGSAEALPDIDRAVRSAWSVIDRPGEKIQPMDEQRLAEADRMMLSCHGIATLAKEMGGPCKALTARRVQYLRDIGAIEPVQVAGRALLYLVGDVRRAHEHRIQLEQLAPTS